MYILLPEYTDHSREWVAQQTSEKQRLSDEEKHANHLYEVKACELDQRAVELAMAEEETRRALNAAHREYNKALVRLSMLIIHDIVHVADIYL